MSNLDADVAVLKEQHEETMRRMEVVESIATKNTVGISSIEKSVEKLTAHTEMLSKLVYGGVGVVLLAVAGAAVKLVVH